MNERNRVLLVEDQEKVRTGLERLLRDAGYSVASEPDAESAFARILETPPDLVLLDLNLPGKGGLELIGELQERGMDVTFVVLTGCGSVDSAVEAMRRGAFDYLEKPVRPERLKVVVERALERSTLRQEVSLLRRELMRDGRLPGLVGRSPRMLELYRMVEQIAPTQEPVLITGESGTGKEIVARLTHRLGRRSAKPLVPINCAAIPENLIESELFGHERGSFTGATATRAGCFERADGGTLFLDEIGELPVGLQGKLLRVLEEHKVRRVGGSREISVDVRVVAATNHDLEEQIRAGRFREDLYFRLNVFALTLPPLRERPEDVSLLAEFFLSEFLRQNPNRRIDGFSETALRLLEQHRWPGNVRELKNAVHRAAVLCSEGMIHGEHLPPALLAAARREPSAPPRGPAVSIPVGTSIADAEKALILRTLGAAAGDKPRAAETLGISLKTLYTRLNLYRDAEGSADDGAPSGSTR